MSCPKGGFPYLRQNEIWDVTANLLSEVCTNYDVTEPHLQPPFGETKLPTVIMQGLTFQPMVFGEENLRTHTLMSEFFTPVYPQINLSFFWRSDGIGEM